MRKLTLLFLSILLTFSLFAQKKSGTGKDNYYYQRGVSCIQVDDYEQAATYFAQALEEEEHNGYAQMMLAVNVADEDATRAFSLLTQAVQDLPKKDKKMRSLAYVMRGKLLAIHGRYQEAIQNFLMAEKLDRKDLRPLYEIADALYQLKEYDLSDNVYKELNKRNPGDAIAAMGIAQNAIAREEYDKAILLLDQLITRIPESSEVFALRGTAYMDKGELERGAQDIVTALEMDDNNTAFNYLQTQFGKKAEALQMAIRKKMTQAPEKPEWHFYFAAAAESNGQLEKALEEYKQCMSLDTNILLHDDIARCLKELGHYQEAVIHSTLHLQRYPQDDKARLIRATCYDELYLTDSALLDCDTLIQHQPYNTAAYYNKAQFLFWNMRYEEAAECYSAVLALDSTDACSYLGYALSLTHMGGHTTEARPAFLTAIKCETLYSYMQIAGYQRVSQFAYLHLGNRSEAEKIQQQMLKMRMHDATELFTAARLYALLGDTAKSMEYLRQALEEGFKRFKLIRTLPEFGEVRQLPEFEPLLQDYQKQ